MTSPKYEDTILEGRVFAPLVRFAIPLMLTLLLQALYGAVDLIVVGKFGNAVSTSAVSNGSQIMQTVSEMVTGLAMGVTVLVARYVGAHDDERAAQAVGGMIRLFIIVGILFTVVMEIFAGDIATLMQVPPEAHDKAVVYLRICSGGLIFITAYNVISSLFRGLGNSKSPLLFITIACITNILGDLLLCGVFKMDAVGAAVATVFAQVVSVAFSIYKIRKDKLPFRFEKRHLMNTSKAQAEIFKIGFPVALQDFLVSVSFLIIMAIMNGIGLVASASVGITEKMFVFLALVPISFMYALAAFVAQNVGAKQEKRAIKALKAAILVSTVFGLIAFSLTFFFGDVLARIFNDDEKVILAAKMYLRGVSFEHLAMPFVFCFLGYFNGIGKTTFVLISGLISSFAVRLPLCYWFSRLPGADLTTIGFSVPLSSASTLTMCVVYYIYIRKKRLEMCGL